MRIATFMTLGAACAFSAHISADPIFTMVVIGSSCGYIVPAKYAFDNEPFIDKNHAPSGNPMNRDLLPARLADFWSPNGADVIAADRFLREYIRHGMTSNASNPLYLAELRLMEKDFDHWTRQYAGVTVDGRKSVYCDYTELSLPDPARELATPANRARRAVFFYYDPVVGNCQGLGFMRKPGT